MTTDTLTLDEQIYAWARIALLSLSDPVDRSDIDAAKSRLRRIMLAIDTQPSGLSIVEAIRIVAFLKQHDNEWFINTQGRPVVLVSVHVIDDVNGPSKGWFTEVWTLNCLNEARQALEY